MRLKLVRDLLQVRRDYVIPLLASMTTAGEARVADGMLAAHWPAGNKHLVILANLSDGPLPWAGLGPAAKVIWGDPNTDWLSPWSVIAAVGGA
jgi:hypothetical protein